MCWDVGTTCKVNKHSSDNSPFRSAINSAADAYLLEAFLSGKAARLHQSGTSGETNQYYLPLRKHHKNKRYFTEYELKSVEQMCRTDPAPSNSSLKKKKKKAFYWKRCQCSLLNIFNCLSFALAYSILSELSLCFILKHLSQINLITFWNHRSL